MNSHRSDSPKITTEIMAFCAVAKFGSFSKASEFLGNGQPTVTEQVRRLEVEMDTALFDRSKRPVQLTPAGMKLARLALPLFEDISALIHKIRRKEISDIVRVAAAPAITDHVLPDVIRAFVPMVPGSQVQLRTHPITEIVELVENGEVDLGVLPFQLASGGLDFYPLFQYPWLLIAPPGHPVLESEKPGLEEISRWPIIVQRQSSSFTAWTVLVEKLRHCALSHRVVLELDQIDSIKRYVCAGLGISMLPGFALEHSDIAAIHSRELTHVFQPETAGFIRPKYSETHDLIQVFIKTLINVTGRHGIYPSGPDWHSARSQSGDMET